MRVNYWENIGKDGIQAGKEVSVSLNYEKINK